MTALNSTSEGAAMLRIPRRRLPAWLSSAACLLLTMATMAEAQEAGDPRRGLEYAQRVCAECHAVLPAERSSPRPELPTFATVANTPGMTGIAIAVWLQTPHKSMPNLILKLEDRNDLIAYIVSLREQSAK